MEYWITGITAPVALSAVALLGYLFGRVQRRSELEEQAIDQRSRDVHFAADELARISARLRQNLAAHHSKINRFLQEIHSISERSDAPHVEQKSPEIDRLLRPADGLSEEIASAYNDLRQHAKRLMQLQR